MQFCCVTVFLDELAGHSSQFCSISDEIAALQPADNDNPFVSSDVSHYSSCVFNCFVLLS